MEELLCSCCNSRVGWMTYSGPHGFVLCDLCKEQKEREDEESNNVE